MPVITPPASGSRIGPGCPHSKPPASADLVDHLDLADIGVVEAVQILGRNPALEDRRAPHL